MTNDQKFCSLMNDVSELLTLLDKADAPHGQLYAQKAKELRKKGFNSSMVRLKELCKKNFGTKNFVSIPLWCD